MLHDASVYLIVFPRCAQQPYRRLRRCVSQLLGALSVQEREDVYKAFPWSDPVRRRLHSSSARHRGGFEASGRRKIPRQHLLGQHLLSLMLLTTACQLRKGTYQQPPLPPSARPSVVHFFFWRPMHTMIPHQITQQDGFCCPPLFPVRGRDRLAQLGHCGAEEGRGAQLWALC